MEVGVDGDREYDTYKKADEAGGNDLLDKPHPPSNKEPGGVHE